MEVGLIIDQLGLPIKLSLQNIAIKMVLTYTYIVRNDTNNGTVGPVSNIHWSMLSSDLVKNPRRNIDCLYYHNVPMSELLNTNMSTCGIYCMYIIMFTLLNWVFHHDGYQQ